jgi:hypothetical protein
MAFRTVSSGVKCWRRAATAEDEAEVERLYQRLKTVGHLDQKNSSDEK